MFAAKNVALVVGASGIIGNALVETLKASPDWHIRAVRRTFVAEIETIDLDLADAMQTRQALEVAGDTTHVFYAALCPDSNLAKEAEINGAMLRNLLDGLKAAGAPLQRVVHYQGAKVYGVHLGPVGAPFYEDEAPRHLAPNFYFDQEDLLRERAGLGEFDWAILRPDVVVGDIAGNPMNIAMVIGAFAALSRRAGVPLRFPGSVRTYRDVFAQVTDAHWLARASLWAAQAPAARNQAFNLVGESFRWERLWHKVGVALSIEVAEPQPFSLARLMPEQAGAWRQLAEQHGLQPMPYEKLVGWAFGDFVFNTEFDMVSDMGKIRRAGFTEAVSSEDCLIGAIQRLAEQGYLPKSPETLFDIRSVP
ncbi:SDR family oxidoreductase [Azomonas macrocytogenes]|uniref:Nucleoside-diphosphate-sugar epimerase n=1 Tax=Azomonas macrocytogenes TaxID=69962 RepID=A0A839T3N5_AZOMA|nr:SDR family oxidoreductase [Azomonas macrocytogenes]MBB3103310.1 nucleoside-diphosphate-sugar epimerase [Azomonas macrocytogenes]